MNRRCLVIAEVGECFNGDMEAAFSLISVAKETGCDYVKFQVLDVCGVSDDDPEIEWFKRVSLEDEEVERLINYTREKGINFIASPENKKKAELLKKLGQNVVKIASTCAGDREMIEYIAANFRTVFVSTGMASIDEIVELRNILNSVNDLYLMHCISEYPTGPLLEKRGLKPLSVGDMRLNMMLMLKNLFPDCKVGYSDHTVEILPPVIAVAMGAEVIEKHITLDRKTPIRNYETGGEYLGTDHVLSLEPGELKEMVRLIRETEIIKGDWKWERSEGEEVLSKFLRKRFRN